MDGYGIPNYGHLATDMPLKFVHEPQNGGTTEIRIVGKKLKYEGELPAQCTHGNGADHRYPTMWIGDLVYRCLPAGCVGAAYQGCEKESCFVHEYKVCIPRA